ncbi:hypothetical protein LX32DRAFT_250701 [Colletotrichum zoysiae]|uniref:Secreted protein n=1 Tax=Colletotrichum zoysiae TaxID=1216348 RepID=A0AAD9H319_9PEZI|nr:hypothetical protein LX32DRAFT_250701 [Colletotrichum zoysiae]
MLSHNSLFFASSFLSLLPTCSARFAFACCQYMSMSVRTCKHKLAVFASTTHGACHVSSLWLGWVGGCPRAPPLQE